MFSKIKTYLAIAGAFVLAMAWVFLTGEKRGKDAAKLDQHKAKEKLQHEYDEIDREPVDFDASISRLRDRK